MLKSLQLRITLIAVAFACLLAVALTAAGGLVVHQQLVEAMSARARLAAGDLHVQLERLMQLGLHADDISGFDAQCQELLARDANLEFAGVFNVYGRRLFGAGSPQPATVFEAWDQPPSGDEAASTPLRAVHAVRARDGRIAAYVVVVVSEQVVREATWRNVRIFVLIALALMLLGLAVHQLVLRGMVTRPLRSLVGALERIDPDDPHSPFTLRPEAHDELSRLAAAFADLLQRLGDARRALVSQNRRLEGTVQERTRQLQEANAALAEDIERRKALEEELRQLASTDALTGLANRSFLMPYLERRLEQMRRQRRYLALLLFDLDGFKPVNDRFGHAAGDRALQAVAQRLRGYNRQSDVLARIGGDEFVVVVEGFEEPAQIEAYGQRLLALFGEEFDLGDCRVTLGVSVGAALFPLDAGDASGLLAQADRAMYRAKAAGGGFSFVGRERAPLNPS